MKNLKRLASETLLFAAVTLAAGLFLTGCGTQCEQGTSKCVPGVSSCCPASATAATAAHDDHGHQHAAEGPHGGELIELGDEQYRAELVHDEAAHKVTVYLLGAEAKKPAASDQTQLTLQIFSNGQFIDYAFEAVSDDTAEAGASQFATVNEKLSDVLLGSGQVRGRLKVSIKGKPITGIIEHHNHAAHDDDDDHDDDDHDDDDHDDHDGHDH